MKFNKKYFPLLWIINIILLIIFLFVKVSNALYSIFIALAFALIFITPLILIATQLVYELKNVKEETKTEKLLTITPNIGCVMITLLTCVNFIQTIEKQAVFEMIIILFTFICFELYFAFITYTNINNMKKQKQTKKIVWIYIATYALLLGFYICAVIMSYDWSIN